MDGTLAHYEPGSAWNGIEIGPPVPAMVARVQRWLEEGREVRIFTARVSRAAIRQHGQIAGYDHEEAAVRQAIHRWSARHIGKVLPVTCEKDYHMLELWDDRAVQVERNTGRPVGRSTRGLGE